MAGFRYEALTAGGKRQKGVIESDSPRQARAWLREQGLTPVQVEAIGTQGAANGLPGRRRSLSTTALAILTRQLSTLLGAGLTIEQSLNALIEDAASEVEGELLGAIRGEVLAGQTLARALANQGRVFPDVYRTLVDAGERSGRLPDVLERLADYTEERDTLRSKVLLAFIYPGLIVIVATVVVGALLTYVVPQVVQVFRNTHQALPLLTRALIALSDLLRALAILAASTVPLLTALQAGAGVLGNIPMREALAAASARVQEGATLSRSLAVSRLFPPLMIHMIASGEASGRLATMLERAAIQQTREMERRVTALVALLEPVMILVMGLVVLLIVLAILMPIFEMNQIIR